MSSTESDMDDDDFATMKRDLFSFERKDEMEAEIMFIPPRAKTINNNMKKCQPNVEFDAALYGPYCIRKIRDCYRTRFGEWNVITREQLNATANPSKHFNRYAQPLILGPDSCKINIRFSRVKSAEINLTNTQYEKSNVLFFYIISIPQYDKTQTLYIVHNDPIDTGFLRSLTG